MKLYYKPGACSLASHIVLNELGMKFELEKTDTDQGVTETGIDYRQINPHGYVPSLQVTPETVITENAAILQYLGDSNASSSLVTPAAGSLERVRLQEMLSYLSSELHKAYSPFFAGKALRDTERKDARKNIAHHIDFIEACLSTGKQYLLGEQFTVADAYAFVILNWSNVIGFSLDSWPTTLAFMQRIAEKPSVIKALQTEGLMSSEASA